MLGELSAEKGVPIDTLHTQRLLLRSWHDDDASFVYDMYSRWEVQRYIGRNPRIMKEPSEAAKKIADWLTLDYPIHGIWAAERLEDQQLVGTVLLKSIPASGEPPLKPSGGTEIRWHLHPDYWGSGYATEAAAEVLRHGFGNGLARIVAVTSPQNTASMQICARLGMTNLGVTSRYYNTTCALFVARDPGQNQRSCATNS